MTFSISLIVLMTIVSILYALPIDESVQETTTKPNDEDKSVTKRHIIRNMNQNMINRTPPFANRPFFNLFNNNNQNINNAGMTNRPNRPFFGLFSGFGNGNGIGNGNRPFLSALQGQTRPQNLQGQSIPALQDEVEGLGVSQDLQMMQNLQNISPLQGLQGMHGFHPFQTFQSHHGMHQSVNGPFGGGLFSRFPPGMIGLDMGDTRFQGNAYPTYTVLGKSDINSDLIDPYQAYQQSQGYQGLQSFQEPFYGGSADIVPFPPTGFPNY